jgi:Tfp pilus assembly protein PilV
MKARWKQLVRKGLTLLESLLAAVILAMVVAAIALPFAAGAESTLQEARQTLAVNLAQDLMEEILAKPVSDPQGNPTPEASRSQWNDMQDYVQLDEVAIITSWDGTVVTDPSSTGLTRHARVAQHRLPGQSAAETTCFLLVTVYVQYNNQTIVTLSRLVYMNN